MSTNYWPAGRGTDPRVEAAGGPPDWLVAIVLRGDRLTDHAEVEEDDAAVVEHVYRYLRRQGTGDAGMVGLDIEGDEVLSVEVLADAVDHEVVGTKDLDEP